MKRKLFLIIISFIFIFSAALLIQSDTASCASKRTKMNVKKLTLTKNDSYTLRVYNMKKKQTVKFVSDDDSIVTISEKISKSKSADITAVNVGSTFVHANIYSKKGKLVRSLKASIKVTPLAISIKFTQKKLSLDIFDTMKLSVLIKPSTSQEAPLFESSDPDIVAVNSKGVVTALTPGEAVITATLLSSGQKAECHIQVLPPEETPDPHLDNRSFPSRTD